MAKRKSKMGSKLKNAGEYWGKRDQVSNVQDGIFPMQMQECALCESNSTGKIMIKRVHAIIDGEFEGETLTDFLHLENDSGPRFIAQFLTALGQEVPEDPCELEEIINNINEENPTYSAQVKTNGDFQNVRIRELLEGGEEDESEDGELVEGDDEDNELIGSVVTFDTEEYQGVEGTVESVNEDDTYHIVEEDGTTYDLAEGDFEVADDGEDDDAADEEEAEPEAEEEEGDDDWAGKNAHHEEEDVDYAVTADNGDTIDVEAEDGTAYEACDKTEFTLLEDDDEAEGDEEEGGLDAYADLIELAKEYDLKKEVKACETAEDLAGMFEDNPCDVKQLAPNEIKQLKKLGVTWAKKKTAAKKKKK